MGLAGWLMLFGHAVIFFYLRFKYIKKKILLEKENAIISVENTKLKEENKLLNEAIEDMYGNTHE